LIRFAAQFCAPYEIVLQWLEKKGRFSMQFSERVFCGRLAPQDIGRRVLLAGWVDAFRDHGGLLFIHLRDRSGIVQIVFSPDAAANDVCRQATALRAEYCIAVTGNVRQRLAGTENPTSKRDPLRSS